MNNAEILFRKLAKEFDGVGCDTCKAADLCAVCREWNNTELCFTSRFVRAMIDDKLGEIDE
ncbi:MAG: hypothetical protein GY941_22225 [Planctomycetes bacterium]|nr:hypothetical protein [Planctomycetota bacterium]